MVAGANGIDGGSEVGACVCERKTKVGDGADGVRRETERISS